MIIIPNRLCSLMMMVKRLKVLMKMMIMMMTIVMMVMTSWQASNAMCDQQSHKHTGSAAHKDSTLGRSFLHFTIPNWTLQWNHIRGCASNPNISPDFSSSEFLWTAHQAHHGHILFTFKFSLDPPAIEPYRTQCQILQSYHSWSVSKILVSGRFKS